MKDGKQAEEMVSKTKKTFDPEEEKVKVGMKRIAQLNKPELPALLSGVVGSAIMGLLFPIFALALASLIGGFYGYGEGEGEMTQEEKDYITSNTRKWSLVFMGMGFAALVGAFIQSYSFNFMGQRLAQRVRVMMMEALLKQEVAYFDRDANSSGALTSKLSSDAMAIRGQFGDTMGLVVQNLVTMVAGLVIAGINSWRMMLVVMAMIPILGVAATIQTKVMVTQSGDEEEMFAGANQTASEAVTSIRTVSAFGMEDQVSDLYARLLSVPTKRSYKQANFGGLGLGFSQFVLFSIYALAFWYMGLEISRGYSTFEEALKAFFAVFLAAFGLGQAQINFPDVAKGGAATKRVFAIVDRKTAIDAFNEKGVRPMECTGNIELHDVTFAYPQRPDAPVFQKFNLSVEAGKTMALVGESGSGKSTVVSLIERFYDPVDGGVLLDGQDIRDLNLHWLRSHVGLVSQEPVLFNMSVADNIRYGRPEASLEQVEEAARAANAHQFIQALPEGYSTMLGEGCIQLSGGQKQRIAIARAIVKDPKVLLLDEATSALDAESERVVQDALDRLMVGRTTIIVAHRLSTIRDADNIAVVYKGHIVEQGSHDELMSKGGSYARLVAHQMKRGK
jgi:ATP-binding cassette subfamily B (MDR/TAP) protein 1